MKWIVPNPIAEQPRVDKRRFDDYTFLRKFIRREDCLYANQTAP